LSVDTACSAALVAMHLGMCSVGNGHIDAALVGGVHVQASPTSTSYVSAASMLSPHGRYGTIYLFVTHRNE
jgi:acyl transferase domain-containing protein